MAQLTVLKDPPQVPSSTGPILLAIVAGGGALLSFLSDPPSGGIGMFLAIVAVFCIPWAQSRSAAGRAAVAQHDAFLARAAQAVDRVNQVGQLPSIEVPFNLQKAEICNWAGDA